MTGSSDPYLVVKIGEQEQNTEKSAVKNCLDPIFGKMFEFTCTLPEDRTLSLTVMDRDRLLRDDVIGSTEIDLEDRFYTYHRATCGIPKTFQT